MKNDSPRVLDYAAPTIRPWPIWVCIVVLLIWPLFAIHIWMMAFLLPIVTAAGVANLIHPFVEPWMYNGHVPTPTENWRWIIVNGALSVIYILLARWHARWRKRTPQNQSEDQ